jgi:cytochrome c biogenesis protein CcmG/thiol:disulfide interchange protein DsbE
MSPFVIAASLSVAAAALLVSAPAKPAPVDLSLTSLTGEKVHLRDLRGKPVLVNFWATWCGPCREEMPMMVEAEKAWSPKGVVFIGASLDDRKTRKDIIPFVNQFHINFPIWTGATLNDLDKLQLGNAVPDTAFVDPDGFVFARVRGEIRREELDARLTWITGDRTGPAPEPLVTHLSQ